MVRSESKRSPRGECNSRQPDDRGGEFTGESEATSSAPEVRLGLPRVDSSNTAGGRVSTSTEYLSPRGRIQTDLSSTWQQTYGCHCGA